MKFGKLRIIKNLIVISFGFVFLFTGYNALSYLQSTMNQSEGIGVISQAIIFASFCVCATLLPKFFLKKFGCKTTLLIAMLSYLPFIFSNLYPHWIIMIPSSIVIGFGAAMLWGSQCTYFNESSLMYSHLVHGSKKAKSHWRFSDESNGGGKTSSTSKRNCSNSEHIGVQSEVETISEKDFNPIRTKRENVRTTLVVSERNIHEIEKCGETETPVSTGSETSDSCSEKKSNSYLRTISENVKEDTSAIMMEYFQKANDSAGNGPIDIESFKPNMFESKGISENPHSNHDLVKNINGADLTETKNIWNILQVGNGHVEYSPEDQTPDLKTVEAVSARFFGFHGLAYHATSISSNVLSYYVLHNDRVSNISDWNNSLSCGAAFCNLESAVSNPNLSEPSEDIRYTLTAISVILAVLSVLLVLFCLDPLQKDKTDVSFSLEFLSATFKFVKRKQALLLCPLSFYIGMHQAFYIGDFTKSYIACAWGAEKVGLVTICYGSACALSSTLSGWLVKYVGRTPLFLAAQTINVTANVLLLLWEPDPARPLLFFVLAGLWGTSICIFWSQLRAFYGVLFREDEEAAFAGFYLWDSLGYCLVFSYSNYICTSSKIYALLFVSTLGVVGYLKAESDFRAQRRHAASTRSPATANG